MSFNMINQSETQTLIRLGLTLRHAKVYLAVTKSGISTIKKISKISSVDRPDLYRIMVKLQELGLIEEIIDKPIKYKAIPIQDGVSILLERKIREISKLRQEAKELLEKTKNEPIRGIQDSGRHFVLIPKQETLIKRLKKATENTKNYIDCVCPKEAFPKGLLIMAECYNSAMKRFVKIRWIIEKSEKINSRSEDLKALINNPFFQYRLFPKPPGESVSIFDKKEIFIATNPTTSAMESPALWSNNRSMLRIVNYHFEILWITAIEDQDKNMLVG